MENEHKAEGGDEGGWWEGWGCMMGRRVDPYVSQHHPAMVGAGTTGPG